LDLASGKIGCRWQSGFAPNGFACAVCFKLAHNAIGARVLPDDGIVDWFACSGIPNDSGFTLIGDADSDEVLRREVGLGKRDLNCLASTLVNLHGVVFYPTRLRQYLPVL
jgi:hypothetical protein